MTVDQTVGLQQVREAAERIAPYAHRTPVITCETLDRLAGRRLFFKCENLQKVGAFKFRGATNAVMKLDEARARRGVVTHSSGNHAQALALAAANRGIAANIVMPSNSVPVKRRAVEGYGGIVHACDPNQTARETTANALLESTGGTLIPPYDHPDIIAGQGTAALELIDQIDDLDAVIAPIGGGGLMAGTCIAAHGLQPDLRVLGAEPTGADDAARSLRAKELIPQTGPDTICDGLLTSLGRLTWPIILAHVASIITVSDAEVIDGMTLVWQRTKLIIEPSAAVAVAALLGRASALAGLQRVGVIISGGNVDLVQAMRWMTVDPAS